MIKIGVIGTGTISSCMVKGLCKEKDIDSVYHFYLSPRNREKAETLQKEFPQLVTVCSSNQEVVDESEWVILAVLPRMGEEIVSQLSFKEQHKILTVMSDHSCNQVRQWTGEVKKVIRMVPLPFIEMGIGPVPIYPKDDEIKSIFSSVGEVIELEKETELSTISALTGIMSAYYMLLHEITKWGSEHELSKTASLQYMTAFFDALSRKAAKAPNEDVYHLAMEMTPGGLNEMALNYLKDKEAFTLWCEALDGIMDRLNKK
ncbi:MAG: NAD(P)-binding domain-containing protein [Lachnospiraceae bacterium]|nr:NAD(P)-binding domain-containing protein [Lachnospiraceae bacterium]